MPSIIDIKNDNIKKVINLLRFEDSMAKKDIAAKLGLSFATVSNICNDLININILSEKDSYEGISVGRNPKMVSLNYSDFYIICIDLHMENKFILYLNDLRGNEIAHVYGDVVSNSVYEYIQKIYDTYNEKFKNIQKDKIIGIGVAVSGIFDKKTKNIVGSEINLFENKPLKSIIGDIFNLPVYIDNEANLCAVATKTNDIEENNDNIVYVYLSEGTGVGIITHGLLLSGERGYGAEICHMPIGSLDKKCRLCGNYGCIESDLSIYGFVQKYYGNDCNGSDLYDKWDEFLAKVKKNDVKALNVINENVIYLGKLISVLYNLFDPERVYIGGTVASVFENLIPKVKKEVVSRLVVKNTDDYVDIAVDADSDKTIVKGAIQMVYDRWLPR